ncbi:hypothetical protein AGLY_005959 [Aphis glycines]|uniref:Uncharacterized protein n=1 Tax=Aphis glycines TaxID=307491 RepID=A0A6G0TSU5_APHGL|nr:hypothetical protein AGLY_005959 [Aphis glycines]
MHAVTTVFFKLTILNIPTEKRSYLKFIAFLTTWEFPKMITIISTMYMTCNSQLTQELNNVKYKYLQLGEKSFLTHSAYNACILFVVRYIHNDQIVINARISIVRIVKDLYDSPFNAPPASNNLLRGKCFSLFTPVFLRTRKALNSIAVTYLTNLFQSKKKLEILRNGIAHVIMLDMNDMIRHYLKFRIFVRNFHEML